MLWSKENPVRFLVLSEDTLVEQTIEEATNHLLLQEYGIEQDPPLLYITPLEEEDERKKEFQVIVQSYQLKTLLKFELILSYSLC